MRFIHTLRPFLKLGKDFPKNARIPLSVIGKLCKKDKSDTIDLCDKLSSSSMLAQYIPLETIRFNNGTFKELQESALKENDLEYITFHKKLISYYIKHEPKVHQILYQHHKREQELEGTTYSQNTLELLESETIEEAERNYLIRFYDWHLKISIQNNQE